MPFFIWSGKEKMWWKPEKQGYTKNKSEAGVYSAEQAEKCCLNSCSGNTPSGADVLVPTKPWHEH